MAKKSSLIAKLFSWEISQSPASTHQLSEKLRRWIVYVFHLLIGITPFFFLTVNEELFEFNKMILTYTLTAIILGLWISRSIIEKKLLIKKTPLDIPILLFLFSQCISTFLSIHPRTSIFGYYTRFNGGLLSVTTYISLLYAYINNVNRKDQSQLLWTLLLSGFGVTLYAIPEHFGYSPSCLLIAGKLNASCWIQDVQARIFGTFGQPNWLAAYVVMLFPLSIFFIGKYIHNKKYVSFSIIASIAFFVTLLFTKSRSGFLGWILGVGIMSVSLPLLFFTNRKTLKKNLLPDTWYLIPSVCLLLFPLFFSLLFGTPFTPSLFDKNTQPIESSTTVDRLEQGGTDSGEIRKIVWTGAIRVWQRYPIFGSGVETFAYSYYQDRPVEHNNVSEWNFLYNKAHNEFLNYLATTGIVGLGTYLILHAIIFFFLLKIFITEKETETRLLSIAIASGLLAVHVSNFFGFSTVMINVLMWLFPAFALVNLNKQPLTSNLHSLTSSLSRLQQLSLLFTGLLTLLGIVKVSSIWFADYSYAQAKNAYSDGHLNDALTWVSRSLSLSPNEALYYELTGKINAAATVAFADAGEAEAASQTANAAVEAITRAIDLNPVHLNFYRSQTAIFLTLAQYEPSLYTAALQSLEMARDLAPTEPKLVYDMGIVYQTLESTPEAVAKYQEAIDLKPNFDEAHLQLGQIDEQQGKYQGAAEEYKAILDNSPQRDDVQEKLDFVATQEAEEK